MSKRHYREALERNQAAFAEVEMTAEKSVSWLGQLQAKRAGELRSRFEELYQEAIEQNIKRKYPDSYDDYVKTEGKTDKSRLEKYIDRGMYPRIVKLNIERINDVITKYAPPSALLNDQAQLEKTLVDVIDQSFSMAETDFSLNSTLTNMHKYLCAQPTKLKNALKAAGFEKIEIGKGL